MRGFNPSEICVIRVIRGYFAATNRDLEKAAARNEFRQDLYYRLKVVTIRTPALRHRPDDIPVLARHFVKKYQREIGRVVRGMTPEAEAMLQNHDWPGNVRELQNVIERAIVLGSTDMVLPEFVDPWPKHLDPARVQVGTTRPSVVSVEQPVLWLNAWPRQDLRVRFAQPLAFFVRPRRRPVGRRKRGSRRE